MSIEVALVKFLDCKSERAKLVIPELRLKTGSYDSRVHFSYFHLILSESSERNQRSKLGLLAFGTPPAVSQLPSQSNILYHQPTRCLRTYARCRQNQCCILKSAAMAMVLNQAAPRHLDQLLRARCGPAKAPEISVRWADRRQ